MTEKLPLTKICSPDDLDSPDMWKARQTLDATQRLLEAKGLLDPLPHPLRLWEYGQALRAFLLSKSGGSVLEVGGSTSLLMPAMISTNHAKRFVQCESKDWINDTTVGRHLQQVQAIHDSGGYASVVLTDTVPARESAGEFDFIACISVVENIMELRTHEAAAEWLRQLALKLAPGGILFFTSDIGEAQPDNYMFSHMRGHIWDPQSWKWLSELLTDLVWTDLEIVGPADFTWTGPHVYGAYNFASMCLRRV